MHMTDKENLHSIFEEGHIYSKFYMIEIGKVFKDISNQSVQEARANLKLGWSGRSLHQYVPLYWGRKTPNVSALRLKNESLIFLMFSTNLLEDYDCVISDGNARTAGTRFRQYKNITDLEILDAKAINSVKYAKDEEIKRRKQAELLVYRKLPLKHLIYIICYSEMVRNEIEMLTNKYRIHCRVYRGAGNYYFKSD